MKDRIVKLDGWWFYQSGPVCYRYLTFEVLMDALIELRSHIA